MHVPILSLERVTSSRLELLPKVTQGVHVSLKQKSLLKGGFFAIFIVGGRERRIICNFFGGTLFNGIVF